MANKNLFQTTRGRQIPATTTVNNAGGTAYSFEAKHALAQMAATGTFGKTYYVAAEDQLKQVIDLCKQVEPRYVAQVALYAREKGYMKDMPAFLCAHLASLKTEEGNRLLATIFPNVIDNGKMLRNFVQLVRSGVTGRKSFGTATKRLILNWIESRRDDALFRDSVGETPSMADIIKMVHPKTTRPQREALYGYLIGRPGVTREEFSKLDPEKQRRSYVTEDLPPLVASYEAYKKGDKSQGVPDVPFQFLTSLKLGTEEWTDIARRAPWHMARMNLNTFSRHGVFQVPGMTKVVADKLRDREAVKKARVFPYQLLAAYMNAGVDVPVEVREGLQDAMEIAIENAPALEGMSVVVCPDVSGSMSSPVTGDRGKGQTSKVRCIDVAALVSAVFLRQNRLAKVLPFENDVVMRDRHGRSLALNPRDSVVTNAEKLASIGGGGTNVSAPLALLNREQAKVDLVIIVSDNESWVDSNYASKSQPYWGYSASKGTETMRQWEEIKRRNPKAKLVCIDIQPNTHTQALDREDILNVGGWSDQVFDLIAAFAKGELGASHWVGTIEAIPV